MSQNVVTIETAQQQPKLPALQAGGAVRAIVPHDFDSAWRIANAVVKAAMAPKGLDTPEKAMVAIMHGLEVGLTPMAALQSIAVVNGRPTIWGDGAIGLVRGSGLLEWMDETFHGSKEGDDAFRAVCVVKRAGEPKPVQYAFSVADAKRAGLWGKQGPWQQYPKRMLQMRARAFALRDTFADVLRGLAIKEEAEDFHLKTVSDEQGEPPAPPAVDASQENAAGADATAMPDPSIDRQAFKQWADEVLAATSNADEFETVWNDQVAPHINDLSPPDQEEVMGIYRRHEARFN